MFVTISVSTKTDHTNVCVMMALNLLIIDIANQMVGTLSIYPTLPLMRFYEYQNFSTGVVLTIGVS